MSSSDQKSISNIGFDNSGQKTPKRYFTKDGNSTVIRSGIKFKDRINLYNEFLNMSSWKFILLILFAYFSINLCFATIYFLLGPESLGIATTTRFCWATFSECFFFSAQTLTTVGYGRISPVRFDANVVASIESLLGLLMFSLVTGLSYGKFSKPKMKVLFSSFGLITKFKEGNAFMFRLATASKYTLTNVEVYLTLALNNIVDGVEKQEFFQLELETKNIINLVLSWTIVHPINEKSPIYNLTINDLKAKNAEFFVSLRGFEEHSSTIIQRRTSYTADEILGGKKFIKIFGYDDKKERTILRLDQLDLTEDFS
jgi:inward rectifier potassium channel